VAADEYGKTQRGCTSIASTSVYKVSGFTKSSYKACFYYKDNCEASSSSDYSMLSGGSGIPSSGGCVGFSNKAIKAYRVTTGDCSGDAEEAWDLTFSKVSQVALLCVWYYNTLRVLVLIARNAGLQRLSWEGKRIW
jgi:hypothetical protein